MFTGIIEDLGTVESLKPTDQGAVISVHTSLPISEITIGDSITVNGACLTVISKSPGRFAMDVSAETLRCTGLGDLKPGSRVNLERCLTLGKLLGGHLVSGHVDGVGRVVSIKPEGDSKLSPSRSRPRKRATWSRRDRSPSTESASRFFRSRTTIFPSR